MPWSVSRGAGSESHRPSVRFELIQQRLDIGEHPHLIAIAEAPPGVTAEEVIADESLIIRDVGFAFAEPGETAKGKLMKLTPGNYVFACFVETPEGVPHFTLGMLGEFTVP
jgi:hypothetical protein